MLISASDLKTKYEKFNDFDDDLLKSKLSRIETTIRNHTHNNFQNRLFRIETDVIGGLINWDTDYLKVGDTIQISDGINRGLYTIKTIGETIETNEPLYDCPMQLITKIEYPDDVIEGAIDLLDWELIQKGKEKVDVVSESISRHSYTKKQRSKEDLISGYPIELFDFCEDYMQARF